MTLITGEQLKRYFWYFFGIMGVVFFWTGVWDGIGSLPYLKIPWVSLGIGLVMLLASGTVFKETDPLKKAEKEAHATLHQVHVHPQKQEFHIKYHDRIKMRDVLFNAGELKKIEKGFLVFVHKEGKEVFVPIHRVTEVLHKGKTFKKFHG